MSKVNGDDNDFVDYEEDNEAAAPQETKANDEKDVSKK